MNNIKNKFIIIAFLSFLFAKHLQAQENVLYYMYDVPQTLLLNPANKYICKTFIELPVLSKFYFGLHNTGFGYNTIITVNPQTGQTLIDVDKIYSKMPKTNFLRLELNTNILGFSFQVRDFYFTFNVSNNTDFKFGLPRDVLALTKGNYQNGSVIKEIDLSNFGVNFQNYTSISASVSKSFYTQWRFGLRAKYIIGHVNLNTKRSVNKWLTSENFDSLNFSTDIQVNSALLLVNTGQSGYQSIGVNENIVSDLLGTLNKNKGFGLDLGAIYNYNEKIKLNASITDLGMIFWKANTTQFNAGGEFTWSALELTDTTNFDQLLSGLVDSIQNAFTFSPTDITKYTTLLPTKIYVGGTYQLHKKILLGVVSKTMFLKNRLHSSLTFSANIKPLKFLTTTFTYSLMDNTYNNLGFGVAIGRKGAQFYIATDKVPINFATIDGIPVPYSARTFDIQFGFNIIFGCSKKLKKIEPMACPQHKIWDIDILQRQKRTEMQKALAKKKSKKILFYKEKGPGSKKREK
ncbi:MAG: hypothetical protein GXO79_11385 [Chlorobi bacterium]|nr:hypothetical protein [Chlorobiota bacterium]